jgi:hypothetical protein
MFGRTVDRWRKTIDLPRRRCRHDPLRRPHGSPAPVLHAISRHVLPRPTDWPPTATVTGYWFLNDAATPPEDLAEFLDAGEAPVFLGFGSMSGPDPPATTETIPVAVRRAGRRAVVDTASGGLTAEPRRSGEVFVTGEVPCHLLFPQVAAVPAPSRQRRRRATTGGVPVRRGPTLLPPGSTPSPATCPHRCRHRRAARRDLLSIHIGLIRAPRHVRAGQLSTTGKPFIHYGQIRHGRQGQQPGFAGLDTKRRTCPSGVPTADVEHLHRRRAGIRRRWGVSTPVGAEDPGDPDERRSGNSCAPAAQPRGHLLDQVHHAGFVLVYPACCRPR